MIGTRYITHLIGRVEIDLSRMMKREGKTETQIQALLGDLVITRFWSANGLDFVAIQAPNVDPGPEIAYWLEDGELRAVEVIDESETDMETIRDQYIYENCN